MGAEWLIVVAGYLVGSIPFAFLLARRAGIDVRRAGSGNVGAANVLRTTRASLGLAVAALDIGKGCAAVLLADRAGAGDLVRTATGVAAIIGHVYPVWLRFRGGKGVATACGVFGILSPMATALAVAVFAATVGVTRYVSLGSVVASAALPPLAYVTQAPGPVVAGALAAATLVIFRHRSNLARLQAGTERRIGQRAR